MDEHVRKLIIIGSGPAGLTAGMYAARAHLKPLIVEGKMPGGQLMGTTHIENWPGEKSILGPTLMQNMRNHAVHAGAEIMAGEISKIDLGSRPFKLWTTKGKELHAHALIAASGAVPKRLGCPGEDQYWGKGVTTCAVCDGVFYQGKKVVVIGGGDTAMEEASFLTKFTDDITLIHILDKLTASYPMQERVIDNPKIKILYNTTVTKFMGDGSRLTELEVTDQKTSTSSTIPTSGAFVAIGIKPSVDIFGGQLELQTSGYLKVTDNTKTSISGVFAAGDVADSRYRQAITSAGAGCMAALDAEKYLVKYLNL